MSSIVESSAHLLRPEAQPVKWQFMTEHQQSALNELLATLQLAVKQLDEPSTMDGGLPWLAEESYSRLVFIDGKRGTGKTTLMLSLVKLLHDSRPNGDFIEAPGIVDTAKELRSRVVILEPLDMEPMPAGTPILSAILARLNQAAIRMGVQEGRAHRGLLDGNLTDEPEYVRFTQLQARIARSLDGNLEARKGGLDREQFGKEVLNQEDDRLMLPSLLAESLALLSAALPGRRLIDSDFDQSANPQKQQRLFLVPIDDVDLNPERCLELLRLLRHYSVPQFFFLLMGQRDLVESIVKLKIGSEFRSIADPESSLSAVAPDQLRKELGQIAAANVQKQIPSVVELPPIDLNSVVEFKPLLGSIVGDPDQLPTLGELLAQVELSDPGVPVSNLRELLQLGVTESFRP